MKNTLIDTFKKVNDIKSNLLHGGYNGEFIDEMVLDVLTTELLESINTNDKMELKNALSNLFHLGEIINNTSNE